MVELLHRGDEFFECLLDPLFRFHGLRQSHFVKRHAKLPTELAFFFEPFDGKTGFEVLNEDPVKIVFEMRIPHFLHKRECVFDAFLLQKTYQFLHLLVMGLR